MFKTLSSGDNHFHVGSRFSECVRVHAWIAEETSRLRPDVFLIPGDLYDADSTPDERSAAASFVGAVAEVCPVILVQGNHGRRRDLRILGKLRARHPVIIEEAAGVHFVGDAAIAAVAWPDRASIAAMLGRGVPAETIDAKARAMMGEVFAGLGDTLRRHRGPKVLTGHFMVDGALKGEGQPLRGAELAIGVDYFAQAHADIVIMGHIHKAQGWTVAGEPLCAACGDVVPYTGPAGHMAGGRSCRARPGRWCEPSAARHPVPVLYTSSPYRVTYGEAADEPSILYAEIDDGKAAWTRLPTPARQMHLLRGIYLDGRLDVRVPETVRDADIRLRYDVPAAERAAGAIAAAELKGRLLAAGAADVQVEAVPEVLVRVRSPEVAAATTIEGQLQARWKLRGASPETQARLAAKLAELRGEA